MSRPAVPFLMYHAIGGERTDVDPVYTVTLEEFEQQMAYLRRAGFQTITMSQFLAWHGYGDPLPAKPILLTFDDGDPSHYELVFPRLRQYGFCGLFAVVPSWIGTPRSFSVEQLRALQAAGMEIISHGLNHLPLTDLSLPQLREELAVSKSRLEGWLGKQVKALAIPRGYCSLRVRQVAYEAGYQVIFTSRPDHNNRECDLFNLGRLPIRANMRPEEFAGLVQAHPARRALEMGSYLVRHSAQRLLGPKRYDRLRAFLLHLYAKGAPHHA